MPKKTGAGGEPQSYNKATGRYSELSEKAKSTEKSIKDFEGLSAEQTKQKILGNNEAIKPKLASFKNKDDGTYSLETGKPISHDDGYQVSFQQSSDNYTDDEFNKKVEEMINHTNLEAHVGVFGGEPEISFHVKDIKEAMKIAIEYNQHSIWDWKRSRIIKNRKYNPKTNKVNKE